MAPVKKIKCEEKGDVKKVQDNTIIGRSKEHSFKLNQVKQVQKKIQDASKTLIRVEYKDDHIKIKPNSGNFKVLSTTVKKLKVGDKINPDK